MSCGPLPPPKNQTSTRQILEEPLPGEHLWFHILAESITIVHGPLKATVLSYNVDMVCLFVCFNPCWEGSILQKLRNPWNYVLEGHASKV